MCEGSKREEDWIVKIRAEVSLEGVPFQKSPGFSLLKSSPVDNSLLLP